MGMNQKLVEVRAALEKLGIQTEPNQESVLDGVLGYFTDLPKEVSVAYQIEGAIQTPEVSAALARSMEKIPAKPKRTKKAAAQ